jgi:hypothetical protein
VVGFKLELDSETDGDGVGVTVLVMITGEPLEGVTVTMITVPLALRVLLAMFVRVLLVLLLESTGNSVRFGVSDELNDWFELDEPAVAEAESTVVSL